MARDKHENSYGEYFLFDTFDEAPVYQHFAGKAFKLLKDRPFKRSSFHRGVGVSSLPTFANPFYIVYLSYL